MSEPKRVLHIVGAMYPGGMENFIMNLYEHIDRDKVQFDFAVHARKKNDYKDRIEELGGRVYELPRLSRHPVKSLKALKLLLEKSDYDTVIRHTSSALVSPQLMVAKRLGLRSVCHSHTETDPGKLLHYLGRILMNSATDVRIACSEKAGRWMYGKGDFLVVKNAIDIDKFTYSEEKRDAIRKEFACPCANIYGHIGNFVYAKNHSYLLDIFEEIGKIDPKAVFFMVGEGELRDEIENKLKNLKVKDRVIMTGMRRDVPAFMSAFDCMIFPSIYEGLPLSLIEAQAASLPILVSDVVIPEVEVTENLVEFLSIKDEAGIWAKRAVEKLEIKKDRKTQREAIREHGYDVCALKDWYEDFLSHK